MNLQTQNGILNRSFDNKAETSNQQKFWKYELTTLYSTLRSINKQNSNPILFCENVPCCESVSLKHNNFKQ